MEIFSLADSHAVFYTQIILYSSSLFKKNLANSQNSHLQTVTCFTVVCQRLFLKAFILFLE